MEFDVKTDQKSSEDKIQRCCYIIPRKHRSCRMQVKKDQKYCAEHLCFDPDNKFRIPCPNDPKHTIDKRLLEEHLLKCNSRLPNYPFVLENVNKKPEQKEDVIDDLTDEIYYVSTIIEKEFEKIRDKITLDVKNTSIVEEDIKTNNVKPKHLKQISSIIGHLIENNFLTENSEKKGILELGVGRGQLAYYMAKMAPNYRYVLIDYSGIKHKADNRLKMNKNVNYDIERIRCPIEHIDVTKIDTLSLVNSFSAVCKHFCGNATDYGINLLIKAITSKMRILGFCLVPCCRHRITYDQYTGHHYLCTIGLDSYSSFAALRQISSWATCGEPNNATVNMEAADEAPNYKYWCYNKKLELGKKAQIIFEYGRILNLQNTTGYNCKLIEYIGSDISPENLMIIGKK